MFWTTKSYAQFDINGYTGYVKIGTQPTGYSELWSTLNVFGSNSGVGNKAISATVLGQYTQGFYMNWIQGGSKSVDCWYSMPIGTFSKNYYSFSDSTFKKNIQTISNPQSYINKLRGVTFKWKPNKYALANDTNYKPDNKTHFGFIAQEVDTALSGFGTHTLTPDSLHAINVGEIVGLLVEGSKAQNIRLANVEEYQNCGIKASYMPNGCAAFLKSDVLNVSSRYIEAKTDPVADKRRFWIDSADNKTLKYWDNQLTPTKQIIEVLSNKNNPNGYAGIDASGKIAPAQINFGTVPNTVCEGNDFRLINARSEKLNFFDHTSYSTPPTNIEVTLATIRIPGGTLGINDVVEISVDGSVNNSIDSKNIRLYWNNAPTALVPTLSASLDLSGITSFSGTCKIVMKNSATTQEISGASTSWNVSGLTNNPKIQLHQNLANDIYIIITGQKSNMTDQLTLDNYTIKINKP